LGKYFRFEDIYSVTTIDNFAYLSCTDGLKVVDVRDPKNINEVGYYDLPGHSWGLAANKEYIYIGNSEYGMLILCNDLYTGIIENTSNALKIFTLSQNYPNPFNPITTIEYSLPKAGDVELSVFNALGQRVVTLVDGYKPAGYYKVNFNGKDLASGVYYYRLTAGDKFSAVKKMLLIK